MKQMGTLQIQMDLDLKEQVEALYQRLGMSFAEAVRVFAAQSLLEGGMPLVIREAPAVRDTPTAYGMLAHYADPNLREQESEGFARAMEEKYGAPD